MYIDQINKRLIIRTYDRTNIPQVIDQCLAISLEHQLEKIWLWAFPEDAAVFMEYGFVLEGILETHTIDKPSSSLAFYLTPYRKRDYRKYEEDELLIKVMSSSSATSVGELPGDFKIGLLNHEHCGEISSLLSNVFTTYPTPMENPDYVYKLMSEDCLFAGVFFDNRLVSTSSAYLERDWKRCEMTDCATLADFRGYSLTERLSRLLETTIQSKEDSYTFYSLARARSFGINRVFHKLGYHYRGRLVNNCNIFGGYEDMNLWVKPNK